MEIDDWKEYYTPNQKLACFVKIINTFKKNTYVS